MKKRLVYLMAIMFLLAGCGNANDTEEVVETNIETEEASEEPTEIVSTENSNVLPTEEPKQEEISLYDKWINKVQADDKREMYENIIYAKEDMDEEMSRGWFDDDTIAFLELITGKEVSKLSVNEQLSTYKNLNNTIGSSGYTVLDFFTTDDAGNSTSEGVFNFLDTVKAVVGEKAVWIDANGSYSFDFDAVGGDNVIAEALGISEELVHIILYAADDAGFNVTIE